jgi:hypothetical protein
VLFEGLEQFVVWWGSFAAETALRLGRVALAARISAKHDMRRAGSEFIGGDICDL